MYNPDHKRIVKLLSGVINLYKFREDKGAQWEELEEESAAVRQQVATRRAAHNAKVRPGSGLDGSPVRIHPPE